MNSPKTDLKFYISSSSSKFLFGHFHDQFVIVFEHAIYEPFCSQNLVSLRAYEIKPLGVPKKLFKWFLSITAEQFEVMISHLALSGMCESSSMILVYQSVTTLSWGAASMLTELHFAVN